MILAMVVMAALILLALSVAAPVVARDLQRQKDLESEHRAEQYVRAIRLFYRANHAYPASIKALENTNNVRYLRKEYVDPLTGKSDWRLIHLGEQKTTIKGFFGQELAGLASGGLGSAAGIASSPAAASGTSSGCNATNSAFCDASGPTGAAGGSGLGSGAGSGLGTTAGLGGTSTPGGAGSTGSGSGAPGSTDASDSKGPLGDGTGGVIVGVGTAKTGDSILHPNAQTTYQGWEFWYDPRIEQMYAKSNILGGGIGSQDASSLGKDAVSGAPDSGATPGTTTPGTTTPGTTTPGSNSPGSSSPQSNPFP